MLGPLLLIVIGVLFLLNNLYPGVFRFGKMWPVILIIIGLAKVFEYFQGHPEKEKTDGKKESQ
jgi:putative Mn2+ efflux pump MntP